MMEAEQVCLVLLDDYFKGEGYCPGGADDLALNAPVAPFGLYKVNNIVNQYQATATTNTDA